MKHPYYFDYMATTPIAPDVASAMRHCFEEDLFGNPASTTHVYGNEARKYVEQARLEVAGLINANPREIIWTSGATEADNLAIMGVARFHQRSGRHIITVKTEHKAVLDSCAALARDGFDISYLDVEKDGRINLADLKAAIRPDTILISVMHLNNETGVIQDIAAIGAIAKAAGVLFHTDAAQSLGKYSIDVKALPVDLISMSAHKIYGPKGIGALYVRQQPRVRIAPLSFGGGQEWGLRAGTLATHQIVGMGAACALAHKNMSADLVHVTTLAKILCEGINTMPGIKILADGPHRYPGCLNLQFADLDAETVLAALADFALAVGSACNSAQAQASHVLLAMGLNRQQAARCVRCSIGRNTTIEAIRALLSAFSALLV